MVKRWLGTSSGVASVKKTSLEQVAQAAKVLLNPEGPCATGRDLLLRYLPSESSGMDIEDESTKAKDPYLTASEREVEAWLITLAIRILISKSTDGVDLDSMGRLEEAVHLSESGVKLLTTHLNEHDDTAHPSKQSLSSLYPLLARMIRYRHWASETATSLSATIVLGDPRAELANTYRISVLRRDVDTQAAAMNCMLRNLLQGDQGIL